MNEKRRIKVDLGSALRPGSALYAVVSGITLRRVGNRLSLGFKEVECLIACECLKRAANGLPSQADLAEATHTFVCNIRRTLIALNNAGYVITLGRDRTRKGQPITYQCTAAGIAIVESFEQALEEEKIRLYKLWNGKK